MAKQKALGMGLEALIQMASTTPSPASSVTAGITEELPLDLIDANPFQPRKDFDEAALDELAESIRLLGIIQPITVVKTGKRYQIISGERRFRAARKAGLTTIPAYQRAGSDNREILLMALEENLQREDLDAIEVALAYQRLIDEFQYTQEELSTAVSKKRSTIANFLRLLHLPPEIQFAIKRRAITMGHAKALVNVQDVSDQLRILDQIISKDLSVREVEAMVARLDAGKKKTGSGKKASEPAWQQSAREQLRARLQLPVEMKCSPDRYAGKIVIPFESQEELEQILHKIQ